MTMWTDAKIVRFEIQIFPSNNHQLKKSVVDIKKESAQFVLLDLDVCVNMSACPSVSLCG